MFPRQAAVRTHTHTTKTSHSTAFADGPMKSIVAATSPDTKAMLPVPALQCVILI